MTEIRMVLRDRSGDVPRYQSDFDARARLALDAFLWPAERYWSFRPIGLDLLPRKGPAVVVMNTGPLPLHVFLLARRIRRVLGRSARILLPPELVEHGLLREAARRLGVLADRRADIETALDLGELVLLTPGGLREAYKEPRYAYRLFWRGATDYAAAALVCGAPIYPSACSGVDEFYRVQPRLTAWLRRLTAPRLPPVPVLRGRFGSLLPRRVPLVHRIGPPLRPPPLTALGRPEPHHVEALHRRAWGEVQTLLDELLLDQDTRR